MKVALWAEIRRLSEIEKLSGWAIARRLHCSRHTVAAALKLEQPPSSQTVRRASVLDPYVAQIKETVEALRALVGSEYEHRLGFQSRTGPVRWVGPGTDTVIEELRGRPAIVVVPVSFVSDHIETLYEIDLLFGERARRAGIGHFVRCESLNDSPLFVGALADLAEPFLAGA